MGWCYGGVGPPLTLSIAAVLLGEQQGPKGYLGVIVPLGYKTVLAVALCQRAGGSCGGRTSFC